MVYGDLPAVSDKLFKDETLGTSGPPCQHADHQRIFVSDFWSSFCSLSSEALCGFLRSTCAELRKVKTEWSLRKYVHSNILKILPPKKKTFRWKIPVVFLFLLKNIDCGYSMEPPRRGVSNEYPQSIFFSRNIAEIRKLMYTPVNPSFTVWKSGLRGTKLYRLVFVK